MNQPGALLERLEQCVVAYGCERAIVALSGGVDSAVVVAVAARALGPARVLAVTALSPSYPEGELESARQVASALGVEHLTVATGEVDREAYARNDERRCFHCKTELYAALSRVASLPTGPRAVVMAGANADDALDFRPGLLAARQQGIRNPLLEQGLGKESVRAIGRHLRLPVADKPAMACLSSRVAFGVRITPDLLGRIDRAERAVRALGFRQVRVRHFGDRASIEVHADEVRSLLSHPSLPSLLGGLRAMGWSDVTVAPAGYRQGSMNDTLPSETRRALDLDGVPPRRAQIIAPILNPIPRT